MQQDLAFEYQPRTFDEFWSQSGAVKAMRQFMERGALPRSTILTGIWGIGKSSLARVVSQKASCLNTGECDPCYKCTGCEWVDLRIAGYGGRFVVYGGDFRFEELQRFCRDCYDHLAPAPYNIWVPVVDELQFIEPKIQQRIVHLIDSTESARFIFCTSEISGIEEALIRRSHVLDMPVPTDVESINSLVRIAEREGLCLSRSTAAEIARAYANNPRDCVKVLQRMKGTGTISAIKFCGKGSRINLG